MSKIEVVAHTPGPWKLEAYDDGAFSVGVMLSPISPLVICARNPLGGMAAESIANARLIAAAPELLAALHAILPFIPTTSAQEGGAARYSENVEAADKVRAAIALATDSQP